MIWIFFLLAGAILEPVLSYEWCTQFSSHQRQFWIGHSLPNLPHSNNNNLLWKQTSTSDLSSQSKSSSSLVPYCWFLISIFSKFFSLVISQTVNHHSLVPFPCIYRVLQWLAYISNLIFKMIKKCLALLTLITRHLLPSPSPGPSPSHALWPKPSFSHPFP